MTLEDQITQAYELLSRSNADVQLLRETILAMEREITKLRLELDSAKGNRMWEL